MRRYLDLAVGLLSLGIAFFGSGRKAQTAVYPDCASVTPVVSEAPGFFSISIPPCNPSQYGEWENYTTMQHRFVDIYQEYTSNGPATVEGGVKVYFENSNPAYNKTAPSESGITGYWHKADLRTTQYDKQSVTMLLSSYVLGPTNFTVFRKPVTGAPPSILVVVYSAIDQYGNSPSANIQ